MNVIIKNEQTRMAKIAEKVKNGERLTLDDGLFLYESDDLLTIGQLANEANIRKNGKNVYFIENLALYFTNVCEVHCAFCNFRRDEGQEGAYTYSGPDVIQFAEEHYHPGVREFHIVGGHNPHVPFQYYVDSIKTMKGRFPEVTMKAYTGAEIQFFSNLSGKPVQEVLEILREAGVESLTGGGAEILSERYRKKMMVEKATVDEWLNVHRTAHEMGMKTHATMLYGAIETLEERLQHMVYLRELQDDTNGFMVFIPLSMQPIKKEAGIKKRNSAFADLKTIAISRLMLDNFQHIKAYFITLGTQLTQLALTFGASDVHGTFVKERISHSAGATSPEGVTRDELIWLVKGAGRTPIERDTFYNVIKEY